MAEPTPLDRLHEGIRGLGQDPAAHPCSAYLAYIDLLLYWNRAYNLSGIRDPARVLTHHVLDSLAVIPWVRGPRCLDLGSGAGLPGLLLALALPDTGWLLLDSNRKKARFLTHAVRELGLENVEVAAMRVEDCKPPAPLDTVTARAFGSLSRLRELAWPLLAPEGRLLALKGARPETELSALGADRAASSVHALKIPGVTEQRHLVILTPGHTRPEAGSAPAVS